jgi:hypothetical protein
MDPIRIMALKPAATLGNKKSKKRGASSSETATGAITIPSKQRRVIASLNFFCDITMTIVKNGFLRKKYLHGQTSDFGRQGSILSAVSIQLTM